MSSASQKNTIKKVKTLPLSEIEKVNRKRKKNKAKRSKKKTKSTPVIEKTPRNKKRFKGFTISWSRSLAILVFVLAILALPIIIPLFLFIKDLPSPSRLQTQAFPVSTIITDRNGEVLYEIYGDTNRNPVELEDLPEYVKWATISIEDKNFYTHLGFSVQGITRAIRNNLFEDTLQGGSTITQQLVKVGLLTPERTLQRKIKEAFLTIGTELLYSKDDILEMYLNHIPYGGTAWGIEAASNTYFDKSAKDLTLAEATLLAGLPQSPTRYSPFGVNPELSKSRQEEVLRRMVEDEYITQEEATSAKDEDIQFATDAISIRAPHFALYVKDLLTNKYGEQTVERGGLRVTTSLDIDLQEVFEASVAAEIESLEGYRVGNGAAVVTKPNTGEILAMVGSKDYFNSEDDGQVNVTIRQRQPGSSIKPINYVIGLELKKFTAGTMWLDVPTCFEVLGQQPYCPKNYDGGFRGPVQTRFALGNSYNIPAVKALAVNGLDSFIATASAMGIESFQDPSRYGLSLTLGGGEVTMLEMATAFGVLANQGVKVPLQPILEVTDWQGNVLESYEVNDALNKLEKLSLSEIHQEPGSKLSVSTTNNEAVLTRVLHRAPAFIIASIMADNNSRVNAFGSRSELNIPNQIVSVKTGTTNNLRDNWTIGFTPEYLTAVWVGNNDNTPMNPYVVSGVTGAAPIFNDIMSYLLSDKEATSQARPEDVVSRPICTTSGLVSNPDKPCPTREELFWEGTEPGVFDNTQREIWVKEDTGYEPEEGDTENIKLEMHTVLSDLLTRDYCVDCAQPLDEEGQPIRRVTKVQYPLIDYGDGPEF